MEHRWGQRVMVDIPIRLSLPLLTAKRARLSNVSLSGGFISLNIDVRVLSRVQIVFEGPRRTPQEAVTIDAYVARKAVDGIGVEWCEFAATAVAELIRRTKAMPVPDRRSAADASPAPRIAASGMGRMHRGS